MTQMTEFPVPTPQDLATWKGLASVDELDTPLENVNTHLQLAADLLSLAVGPFPSELYDARMERMVRVAILDMAWYIGTTQEHRDEMFSPFSSETIGSYTYSKMASAVNAKIDTGVPFFDLAVKYLSDMLANAVDGAGAILVSSERVFPSPLARWEAGPLYRPGFGSMHDFGG